MGVCERSGARAGEEAERSKWGDSPAEEPGEARPVPGLFREHLPRLSLASEAPPHWRSLAGLTGSSEPSPGPVIGKEGRKEKKKKKFV